MTSLETGLCELGISFDEGKISQINRYYNMLMQKNKVMNLTAITEYEEVVSKHFLDSLSLVKVLPEIKEGKKYYVLDMGTGAGFPGIPLKIFFPELHFVLMDSLNKRITFLNDVIGDLGLKNIKAIHARAEEIGRKEEFRERFDLCVSRAVARMASLSEFCIPFVKKGGYFVPYKSGKAAEEIMEAKAAIKELGGEYIQLEAFSLPMTDMERSLILIKKIANTPLIYPRSGGKPLKSPIL